MNSTINKMQEAVKIHKQIDEVASGIRGFIRFPKKLEVQTGIKQASVAKWASEAGLKSANHGRFGLCFTRA